MGDLPFDALVPLGWTRWQRHFDDRAAMLTSMNDVTALLGRLHRN